MKNHPVEFLKERSLIEPGIFFHPVNAYIDIRVNWHFGCRVLEGDNVGVSVMMKKVIVDLK
jgi:hypothetical protein